jgi:hypothetical protein
MIDVTMRKLRAGRNGQKQRIFLQALIRRFLHHGRVSLSPATAPTLSNYANHLFHTPLDEVFAARAWKEFLSPEIGEKEQ